MYYHFPRKV